MTPDAWSNLQILNCTKAPIYSGSGGDNQGFFNQYQMSSWFGFPDAPIPVVAERSAAKYLLQFLRGAGDQNDAADIQLNVGSGNGATCNVAWLRARSMPTSAHNFEVVVQQPQIDGMGPFVVGVSASGDWNDAGPTGMSWYGGRGLPVAGLGAPNADQCLAIVDLGALYPAGFAQTLAAEIAEGQCAGNDAASLWMQVSNFLEIWVEG